MCLFHFCVMHFMFFLTYFRAEYECFQIELSKNYGVAEWREDIKNCMKKAGLDNNPIVFLFSDTQVRLSDSPSPSFLPLSLPPSLPSLSLLHPFLMIKFSHYYFRSKVSHSLKTLTIYSIPVTFQTYTHLRTSMLYIMV